MKYGIIISVVKREKKHWQKLDSSCDCRPKRKAHLYCIINTAHWRYKMEYKPADMVYGYVLTINFPHYVKKTMYCLRCHTFVIT